MRDYRSLLRVADTSTSTHQLARRRRGPHQRVDRAGRDDARVAPPERRPASTTARRSATAGDRRTLPDSGYTEERSIGFRVRDASGSIRVFPRGARFDAAVRFEGETGLAGDEPPGLDLRRSGATQNSETDRAIAVAALLEVRQPDDEPDPAEPVMLDAKRPATLPRNAARTRRRGDDRRPRPPLLRSRRPDRAPIPARSPTRRSTTRRSPPTSRRHGRRATLADDPAAAWGNAAIPGFGIGRPVSRPTIDPAAHPLPLAARRRGGTGRADASRSRPRRSCWRRPTRCRC